MDGVIGLIAAIVAILGVLAAVGYGGYLLMLRNVASKRPGADHLATDATKRLPAAGGITVLALFGLLITGADSTVPDIIGLLLAGGAGLGAVNQLQAARRRLAAPPR